VPVRIVQDGLLVQVRLTPRGGRDAIEGVMQDAAGDRWLKARVTAAPEDNRANEALRRLLADQLGVRAGDVTLAAGHTARTKRLHIAGDAPSLIARLPAEAVPPKV